MEFTPTGEREFSIHVGKMRAGDGHKVPERIFRIEDTDDGGINILSAGDIEDVTIDRLVDKMAEAVAGAEAGYLTTKELREAVKGGSKNQTLAMQKLEESGRAYCSEEAVPTKKGYQQAKVWRPAP